MTRLIAQRGVASRREAERLVREGQVTVNGSVIDDPGYDVDPGRDHVKVQGKRLPEPSQAVVLALHKPAGTVTSERDPEGRKTVVDLLEGTRFHGRVHPVGRLDYGSEGLLLLTNDGDLAYRLTHPRYHVPKVYLVKVTGDFDERKARSLRRGIPLEDGRTSPAGVEIVECRGRNTWLRLAIREGRNRVVRRMVEFVGHKVLKLRRESFGGIDLGDLPHGAFRVLDAGEIKRLREVAEGGAETFEKLRERVDARGRHRATSRAARASRGSGGAAGRGPGGRGPVRKKKGPGVGKDGKTSSGGAKDARRDPGGAKDARRGPGGAKDARRGSGGAKDARRAGAEAGRRGRGR